MISKLPCVSGSVSKSCSTWVSNSKSFTSIISNGLLLNEYSEYCYHSQNKPRAVSNLLSPIWIILAFSKELILASTVLYANTIWSPTFRPLMNLIRSGASQNCILRSGVGIAAQNFAVSLSILIIFFFDVKRFLCGGYLENRPFFQPENFIQCQTVLFIHVYVNWRYTFDALLTCRFLVMRNSYSLWQIRRIF